MADMAALQMATSLPLEISKYDLYDFVAKKLLRLHWSRHGHDKEAPFFWKEV